MDAQAVRQLLHVSRPIQKSPAGRPGRESDTRTVDGDEPDAQLGFLFGGATMGMLLSAPLVLFGVVLILYSLRRARRAANDLAAEGP